MITNRFCLAGAGASNTAALAFGGLFGGVSYACTETYNGSTWSAGGALSTARYSLAGAGTNTAALAFGGSSPVRACTETYNGTSWSAGGALITARSDLAGAGTNTAALAFGGGGNGPIISCTEAYNGTSWSAGGALITARYQLAGAGTNTAALAFGGATPIAAVTCTETYTTGSTTVTKTFDYSNTTGNTTISCLVETSAQRYKNNIQALTSQLEKVSKLKPVSFDWKSNQKHDIGFIAEQVQEVYPEIVNTNEQGEVEGLSYSKLSAAFAGAIQEQQVQLEQQQAQIQALITEINNLKNK